MIHPVKLMSVVLQNCTGQVGTPFILSNLLHGQLDTCCKI